MQTRSPFILILALCGASCAVNHAADPKPGYFDSAEEAGEFLRDQLRAAPDSYTFRGFLYRYYNDWGGHKNEERFSIIRVPMTNRIEARYVLFGNLLFRPDELWKKGLRTDAEFTAALIEKDIRAAADRCPLLPQHLEKLVELTSFAAGHTTLKEGGSLFLDSTDERRFMVSNGSDKSVEIVTIETNDELFAKTIEAIDYVKSCGCPSTKPASPSTRALAGEP